jgi:hypothetical protein
MEFSFRQRSQDVQLSKPNGALTKSSYGGRSDRCRNQLRRYNFQPRPLPKMMRLAEDGAMFTIARFEKQFSYLQGHGEILRIACKGAGISSRYVH